MASKPSCATLRANRCAVSSTKAHFRLAQITHGSYSRLSDASLDTLYNQVIATLPRSERESEMQERRIERYQWALSIACLLLVVELLIRRRKSSIAPLAIGLH